MTIVLFVEGQTYLQSASSNSESLLKDVASFQLLAFSPSEHSICRLADVLGTGPNF